MRSGPGSPHLRAVAARLLLPVPRPGTRELPVGTWTWNRSLSLLPVTSTLPSAILSKRPRETQGLGPGGCWNVPQSGHPCTLSPRELRGYVKSGGPRGSRGVYSGQQRHSPQLPGHICRIYPFQEHLASRIQGSVSGSAQVPVSQGQLGVSYLGTIWPELSVPEGAGPNHGAGRPQRGVWGDGDWTHKPTSTRGPPSLHRAGPQAGLGLWQQCPVAPLRSCWPPDGAGPEACSMRTGQAGGPAGGRSPHLSRRAARGKPQGSPGLTRPQEPAGTRGTAGTSRDRGGPGHGGRASLEGGLSRGEERARSLYPGRACVVGAPLGRL
ncbi:hypothetical protein HJG60_009643 [Phyllostomus discolor]|uniref:Uncharacterized protein n=1 Tax=Phyllostomus discolor TaxID=89673 RepID=A0A834ESU3_9CHIR|nr:hypothetical protein HJG60_009643 [Phyllostomus discolor]